MKKIAVAMMRGRGTSGRRISTWASPFELHAGMAMPKGLKPYILLGVAIEKRIKKKSYMFRSNFPMNDWQLLFMESIENFQSSGFGLLVILYYGNSFLI